MTPSPDQGADLLRQQILEDARAEAEKLISAAGREVEVLRQRSDAAADQDRSQRLSLARAEAERRAGWLLDSIPVEFSRRRETRRESLLEAVLLRARQRVAERADRTGPGLVERLAAAAITAMDESPIVLRVHQIPPAPREANERLKRATHRPDLELRWVEDPAVGAGGVVVESASGRQRWDNRLEARLDRLWPELRRQVAGHAGWLGPPVTPTAQGHAP